MSVIIMPGALLSTVVLSLASVSAQEPSEITITTPAGS